MNRIWHINELDQLIDYVKANQGNKNIILLHGDIGSGKTTFVRKYCEKINIINQVSSPSFLILNSYNSLNNMRVNHFDFYRVEDISELEMIGLYEILNENNSLTFIEWPDKFSEELKIFKEKSCSIYFNFIRDNINQREVRIEI